MLRLLFLSLVFILIVTIGLLSATEEESRRNNILLTIIFAPYITFMLAWATEDNRVFKYKKKK